MIIFFEIIKNLLNLPKSLRILILLILDLVSIFFGLKIYLYLTGLDLLNAIQTNLLVFLLSIIFTSFFYFKFGQYKNITRFIGSKDLYKIFIRNLILIFFISSLYRINNFLIISFSTFIFIASIITLLSCTVKLIMRDLINYFFNNYQKKKLDKVVIYGAGSAGIQLNAILSISNAYSVCAFVDDNKKLWGRRISGIPIISKEELNVISSKLDKILFAIPSISFENKKNIFLFLQKFNLPLYQIPSLEKLATKNSRINDLKPIEIDDLLGREIIPPDQKLIKNAINDYSICVTGAGGSIGSEICKEILELNPKKLFLIERNEHSLYLLLNQIKEINLENIDVVPILCCLTNQKFVEKIFLDNNFDIIYHCAAYKHVPLVEINPLQGIYNNIFSTISICKAALKINAKKVILISSDKAVRPTNIMGASKRICELIIQSYAENEKKKEKNNTIFSMVRFGNVIGSSGSVVPLFKKQIEKGGPITLTHKSIIRYFMTIKEAAQLVLQASSLAKGGEVFLLDMGEPIKIFDLACLMVKLSGFSIRDQDNPEGDIEILTTGLRPGEKLFEELIIDGESVKTIHPLIFYTKEKFLSFMELQDNLVKLDSSLSKFDKNQTFLIIKKLVPDWRSYNN